MSWAIGREAILAMLDAGDLEQVAPNSEFAQTLIDEARKHLATADLLQDTDLQIAFDALHTAARLSVTALLATQGLRPTTKGGHIAPIKAVRAQLGVHAKVLRSYDRLRVTRNRTDYPSHRFSSIITETSVPTTNGLVPLRMIKLHDLRKGAASLGIASGAPIEIVSKRLGHSSISVTADIYGHLLDGVGHQAAEAAAALVPRV